MASVHLVLRGAEELGGEAEVLQYRRASLARCRVPTGAVASRTAMSPAFVVVMCAVASCL